jgi:hypothetical protein
MTPNSNMNVTLSFSLQSILAFFLLFLILFIGVNYYTFYCFKAELNSLNLLIHATKLENVSILEKLNLENSLQASKILILENAVSANPTLNTVVASQPVLDIEVVKFIFLCLSIIGLVVGSYYCFHIFFQKSIIGKVVGGLNYWACSAFDKTFCGGSSFVKTIIIPFNEQKIELKIEIRGNDTCAVTYKYLSDNVFLPFERFLEEHKSLLDRDELTRITDSFIDSSSKGVVDVINNSPELAVYGEEAFKAVFSV